MVRGSLRTVCSREPWLHLNLEPVPPEDGELIPLRKPASSWPSPLLRSSEGRPGFATRLLQLVSLKSVPQGTALWYAAPAAPPSWLGQSYWTDLFLGFSDAPAEASGSTNHCPQGGKPFKMHRAATNLVSSQDGLGDNMKAWAPGDLGCILTWWPTCKTLGK